MEQDVFQEIYQKHYPSVYRVCLGYMKGSVELAEDLAQEVLIRIWERYDSFKGESELSTWIFRIAVNCCLTEIRRNKSFVARNSRYEAPLGSSVESQQSEQEVLIRCIELLDEGDRVLAMLVLEDLSTAEVAKILGINEGNARVKIHRLKERLREAYLTKVSHHI